MTKKEEEIVNKFFTDIIDDTNFVWVWSWKEKKRIKHISVLTIGQKWKELLEKLKKEGS